MNRETKHAAGGYGRQPEDAGALQFASVETILRLTNGKNGWGHCPCHPDKNPSLEVKRGREPGRTLIKCWAGCSWDDLKTHFRKNGWRLGPMTWRTPPKVNRPVSVVISAAFRALTQSERAMFHLIEAGCDPTYNDMEEAGVRRKSIAPGLRAMQALGLISVKRANRAKGRQQYERSHYWVAGGWLRWEPKKLSKGTMQASIKLARIAAKAARKGDEDIIQPPVANSENRGSGLLVSEVALRGGVLAPDSYESRTLASKSQDSSRPTTFDEGHRGWSSGGKAKPAAMPVRQTGDPGPTEDSYGADPAPSQSNSFNM
jgi:hypothetical protein